MPTIRLAPLAYHLGFDTSDHIPLPRPDLFKTYPLLGEIWGRARGLWSVCDNDSHKLYALTLAAALLDEREQADADVVLPAMMLHDIGWSQVEPGLVLPAIAPAVVDPIWCCCMKRKVPDWPPGSLSPWVWIRW